MADNTGREGEEALFEIIRSPSRPDDLNEANDGSQYLNNTGEGDDKIFDLDDRADEVMNYDYDYDDADNDYDDEYNVDLEITKTTGEVYLYSMGNCIFTPSWFLPTGFALTFRACSVLPLLFPSRSLKYPLTI